MDQAIVWMIKTQYTWEEKMIIKIEKKFKILNIKEVKNTKITKIL